MATDAIVLALIFAMRSTLLVLYGCVLFAYWAHAKDFVWSERPGESGDTLAAGIWLVTAGALCANLNSMGVMLLELGTLHGSPVSIIAAMAGLWAGFFLIWNAWVSASYELPFQLAAVYSAAALAGAGVVAGASFLGALALV
jgi:hypothetical protein